MNERYTYGYGMGWNVDNEYISSLNDVMTPYKNQAIKINKLKARLANLEPLQYVERENVVYTDEQLMQWYNKDYPEYNSSFTFAQYKEQILKELEYENEKRNQERRQRFEEEQKQRSIEMSRLSDEIVANQFYSMDIKQDMKRALHKKKNELELVLSEKKIQLSSINLEQQKTRPLYDEDGNILNSKELQELRKKYDDMWLEVRKVEHALSYLNDCFKLMEFTEEEAKLMLRSLNPQQRRIYESITYVPQENAAEKEESKEENIEEEKVEEEKNNILDTPLKQIVDKVCGSSEFTAMEARKYNASNIKVFKKPEKGISKLISIPKAIIGVIPRAAMKLYGMSISEESKNNVSDMQSNAMKLTDEEVLILFTEYKDNLEFVPNGFSEIVKPRVNLYLSSRLDTINQNLNDKLLYIAEQQEIISNEEDQKLVDEAYTNASSEIKSFIPLQLDLELYLKNSKLHSFKTQLKALKSKLDYAGARFANAKDYDSGLWSRVSGLSQKVEYSLNPKEIVHSYTEREKIYKEHNKHKNILPEKYLEKLNEFKSKFAVKKEENMASKRTEEVRSLIENLKAIRAEITDQDVKEIEDLLKTR